MLAVHRVAGHISGMALHLQKLCVGADSVEDLTAWIEHRMREKARQGLPQEHIHTTRMAPKRVDELLDGGSLYWVIKGVMQARQRLIDIRTFTDADGIGRCELVMEPKVVRVEPRARRAFQGWRYLPGPDAPKDLSGAGDAENLPAQLLTELRALGLW